jgi:hypothetical protein
MGLGRVGVGFLNPADPSFCDFCPCNKYWPRWLVWCWPSPISVAVYPPINVCSSFQHRYHFVLCHSSVCPDRVACLTSSCSGHYCPVLFERANVRLSRELSLIPGDKYQLLISSQLNI